MTGPPWLGNWGVCLKLLARWRGSGCELSWDSGCSPRSCTGLLVLLQASPAPVPMSAAPQLSWVWPANMIVHSQKLCMTKAVLGCSTGNFYYPAYFKAFWLYDPVYFLWLNARFLCPSNFSLFSLMNSVHSNMYVLEQIQHKVPEEALKVRVAGCSAFKKTPNFKYSCDDLAGWNNKILLMAVKCLKMWGSSWVWT